MFNKWATLTILVTLFFSLPVFAETTLEQRRLLEGQMSILIPVDFVQMGEDMMRLKYPSENRPTYVLTNENGSVNIAINHMPHPLLPEEVSKAHAAFDKLFHNLYPSAQWNQSKVTSLNNRPAFILDLVTPAVDTTIRNIMIGMPYKGRMLMVTFNCTTELNEEWARTGYKILKSIKLQS